MLRLYDKPNSNFQANSQVPSQSPHRIVFIGFLNLLGLKSGRFLGNQPKTVLFFFVSYFVLFSLSFFTPLFFLFSFWLLVSSTVGFRWSFHLHLRCNYLQAIFLRATQKFACLGISYKLTTRVWMLILHRVLVLCRVNLGVKLDLQIQVSFHFFMSFLKNEIVQGTNNAIKMK